MKVIGIVEDNPITGVRYGLIEIPEIGAPINIPTKNDMAARHYSVTAKNKGNFVRKTCKTR